MRSVLIVGPMFEHCDHAVSPARRLFGYARHLPRMGWKVVVLAPACRCTIDDYGEPGRGEVVRGGGSLVFDPKDGEAMRKVRDELLSYAGEQPYVALRPVLRVTRSLRRWARAHRRSGVALDRLREKLSWHQTPTFDPDTVEPLDHHWRRTRAVWWWWLVGAYVRAHGHQAARRRMLEHVVRELSESGLWVDAVIGSHGQAPEVRAAALASRRWVAPLVVEMRDALWRLWKPMYDVIELVRAGKVIRKAEAVVHVTTEEQNRDLWWLGHRMRRGIIEQSFEPEEWDEVRRGLTPDEEVFTLRFLGSLYPRLHVGVFIQGFVRFLQSLPEDARGSTRFEYAGPSSGLMQDLVEESVPTELRSHVLDQGRLPRAQALRSMASASVLILPMSPGIPGGRFYEYLGSRRPILAVGQELDPYVAGVLRRTGAGRAVTEAEDVALVLGEWWATWQTGHLGGDVDETALGSYTSCRQAQRMATLLDDLTATV